MTAKARVSEWTAETAIAKGAAVIVGQGTRRTEETAAVSVYKARQKGRSIRPSLWLMSLPCGDAQDADGGTPPFYTEPAQARLAMSLSLHQRPNGSSKSRMSGRDVRQDYIGSALLATCSTPLSTECVNGKLKLRETTPPHLCALRRYRLAIGHASVAPSDPSPTTLGIRPTCAAQRGQGTEPLRLMRREKLCNLFDS